MIVLVMGNFVQDNWRKSKNQHLMVKLTKRNDEIGQYE
jgi:hypothetical protein